jgi:hypothetical protein
MRSAGVRGKVTPCAKCGITELPQCLPSTTELYPLRPFAERHPNILNYNRVVWAVRHRKDNGLKAAGAVFDSPCGELLIHEPAFLAWFLGLAGMHKPRRARTRSRAVEALA